MTKQGNRQMQESANIFVSEEIQDSVSIVVSEEIQDFAVSLDQ